MTRPVTRRDFLRATAAACVAGGFTDSLFAWPLSTSVELVAVESTNYYDATVKAVEAIGGIRSFVSKGSRIGILVNSSFDKPGTFVKPQIPLAVVSMCFDAGAKEIVSLEDVPSSYWRRATLSKEHAEMIRSVRSPQGKIDVPVAGGTRLSTVGVTRDLMECDVYINIPVFKDHEGTRFTGCLKNLMGATRGSTNRSWHKSPIIGGYYDDIPYLSDCIASGNLVRKPTLCVGDCTEVIVTNGPSGPGRIIAPHVVVAGTDPVAVDACGATLLGLDPGSILMIGKAMEIGVGSFGTTPVVRFKG